MKFFVNFLRILKDSVDFSRLFNHCNIAFPSSQFTDALKAVAGETNCSNSDAREINVLALDAIKYISKNSEIVSDLHSAIYMFLFAQTLVKHIPGKDAYVTEVCKLPLDSLKTLFQTWEYFS